MKNNSQCIKLNKKILSLVNSGYKQVIIKDCIEVKPSKEFTYGMIIEENELYKNSVLIKDNNVYIIFYSDTFNQYFEVEVNKKDIVYMHYIDSGIDNYIENKR